MVWREQQNICWHVLTKSEISVHLIFTLFDVEFVEEKTSGNYRLGRSTNSVFPTIRVVAVVRCAIAIVCRWVYCDSQLMVMTRRLGFVDRRMWVWGRVERTKTRQSGTGTLGNSRSSSSFIRLVAMTVHVYRYTTGRCGSPLKSYLGSFGF